MRMRTAYSMLPASNSSPVLPTAPSRSARMGCSSIGMTAAKPSRIPSPTGCGTPRCVEQCGASAGTHSCAQRCSGHRVGHGIGQGRPERHLGAADQVRDEDSAPDALRYEVSAPSAGYWRLVACEQPALQSFTNTSLSPATCARRPRGSTSVPVFDVRVGDGESCGSAWTSVSVTVAATVDADSPELPGSAGNVKRRWEPGSRDGSGGCRSAEDAGSGDDANRTHRSEQGGSL